MARRCLICHRIVSDEAPCIGEEYYCAQCASDYRREAAMLDADQYGAADGDQYQE